jgi:hypothetical protein
MLEVLWKYYNLERQATTLNFDPKIRQTFLPLRSEARKTKTITITVRFVETLAEMLKATVSNTLEVCKPFSYQRPDRCRALEFNLACSRLYH